MQEMSMDQQHKPRGAPDGAPAGEPATLSPAKLAEKQRLAEALRANLRRRKAQSRLRRAEAGSESSDK
jgi:hypothetical protein